MLDDFLVRAALAAVGTALAASVLGCFVVWRRMAYFGDATAHAAILGVAFALALNISIFAGVAVVALVVAVLIHRLSDRAQGTDTILGVIAHGALATGLVAVTLIPGARINLEAYLFGDVLTVSRLDIAVIWGGAAVVLGVLWVHWSALLTATLNPDLATASGIDPRRENLILTLLLACVVAVAIKVVGALLITALLVIPAAAARRLATSPEGMALRGGDHRRACGGGGAGTVAAVGHAGGAVHRRGSGDAVRRHDDWRKIARNRRVTALNSPYGCQNLHASLRLYRNGSRGSSCCASLFLPSC